MGPAGTEVRTKGLREGDLKLVDSKEAGWSRQAVLLYLADGWAPIELLEGMRRATGRHMWRRWLGCARAPAIRQGFGLLRLDAPVGSRQAGKVRTPARLASRRSDSALPLLFPTSGPYLSPSISSRAAGGRHEIPRRSDFLPISSRTPASSPVHPLFFLARGDLATLGRQIEQGRHLTHAELGDPDAQKLLAPRR